MRGIPKVLNTKADVDYCVKLALAGKINKSGLKKKIKDLLSDKKVWVFSKNVDEAYSPAKNEKTLKQTEIGKTTPTYICFEIKANLNARFLKMGLKKSDIRNIINRLKA